MSIITNEKDVSPVLWTIDSSSSQHKIPSHMLYVTQKRMQVIFLGITE